MFKRISVLWLMWFVASICGYAIDLNSSNISGDLFLNQVIFSILIAGSKIVRNYCLTFLNLFSGSGYLRYSVSKIQTSPSSSRFSRDCNNLFLDSDHFSSFEIRCWYSFFKCLILGNFQGIWILVVNVIGTVFIEMCWDACYLCGVEVMPTAMRATTMGSCSLIARIGAIMAPMVRFNVEIEVNLLFSWPI